MNVLDLFSGIGGFSIGMKMAGMQTVAFCEKDKFCRQVLKKHWPKVPCYDDIHTLTAQRLKDDGIPAVDLICGGTPCQPFSVAGRRAGTQDDRHLWPQMLRVIEEIHPAWVVLENVTGLLGMVFEHIAIDLEGEGYAVQPFIIPACGKNLPHIRNRIFLIAHTDIVRQSQPEGQQLEIWKRSSDGCDDADADLRRWGSDVATGNIGTGDDEGRQETDSQSGTVREQFHADAVRQRRKFSPSREHPSKQIIICADWRKIKPTVCRSNNGVSKGLDIARKTRIRRLKALGNAVAPPVIFEIGKAIKAAQNG